MVGTEIASAYAKVGLDPSELESGLSSAKSKFSSAVGDMESQGKKSASAIGDSFKTAFAALGVGLSFGAAVNEIKSFQEESYTLERQSHLTGEALKQVTDYARDLSTTSAQSRESIMSVATALASIDKTVPGLESLTKSVADLSEVSGISNTEIANLDKQISKVWKEGTDGILKLNDAAIGLRNAFGAPEDKILSFTAAFGPLAQTVGVTEQEAMALGATFQKAGIDGEEAIQSIYTGTNNLIKNVDSLTSKAGEMTEATKKEAAHFTDAALEAQSKLSDIGRVFGETGEQIRADFDRDYVGTLIKLGAHLRQNAGDTQALQAATELFGARGVKALMMLGDSTKTYNEALKVVDDAVGNAAAKHDLLSKKAEELGTKFGNIINIGKDIALTFGEMIAKPLGFALDKVIQFGQGVRSVMETLRDKGIGAAIQQAFGAIGDLSGAEKFVGIAAALGTILVAAGALAPVLGVMAAALGAFLSPVAILTAGAIALAGSFNNWGAAGKTISGIISSLTKTVTTLWEDLRKGDWKKAFNDLKSAASSAASSIYDYFSRIDWRKAVQSGIDTVKGLISKAIDFGTYIYDGIKSIDWAAVVASIKSGLSSALTLLTDIGKTIYDAIVSVKWSDIGQTILKSLGDIASQISDLFSGIKWGDIGAGITSAINSAIEKLSDIGSRVLDYFDRVRWEEIGSKIADGIKTLTSKIGDIASSVADLFRKHPWDSVGQDIGTKIKDAIGKVTGWAQKVIDGFRANMADFGLIGTEAGGKIKDALGAIKDYGTAVYTALKDQITSWITGGGPKQLGIDLGTAISIAIKDGIIAKFNEWKAAGGDDSLWGAVKGALGEAAQWTALGAEAILQFAEGFSDATGLSMLGYNIRKTILDAVAYALEQVPFGAGAGYAESVRAAIGAAPTTGTPSWAKTTTPAAAPTATTSTKLPAGASVGSTMIDENGIKWEVFDDGQWHVVSMPSTAPAAAPSAPSAPSGPSGAIQWTANPNAPKGGYYSYWLPGMEETAGGTAEEIAKKFKEAGYSADEILQKFKEAGGSIPDLSSVLGETAKDVAGNWKDGAKESTDILKDGIFSSIDDFLKSSQSAGAQIVSSSSQGAGQLRGAALYAQTALKLGAEVGGTFLHDASQTVAVSLDQSSGKLTAYIGSSAEKLQASSQVGGQSLQIGGQQGGEMAKIGLISGSTQAASKTTTAATTFQSRIDSAAATAMNAIAKAGDPAQKLILGAQAAANMLVQAGQAVASAVSTALSRSYYGGGSTWIYSAYDFLYGWQEGTVTKGPQMALIGEDGSAYPEFVIPTKKKRWDLLYQAMRAYGIPGLQEGGSTGEGGAGGATDAEEMRAYFGIKGLASMSKQVQKIINDLKDFFRISWSIIKSEGAVYWKGIETVISNEVTLTRDAAWQGALDIRNVWLQSTQQILSDTTTQWAALWPAIEPSQKSIHDNIISSWTDIKSQVSNILNMMAVEGIMQLTTFQSDWNVIWSQLLADLQNTSNQITQILQQIAAEVANVQVNATVNIGGGGGGYGLVGGSTGAVSMTGTGTMGTGNIGSMVVSGDQVNFIDEDCLGNAVLVNALKYTNPAGYTYYINPLNYADTGGIAAYQGTSGIYTGGTSGGGGGTVFMPASSITSMAGFFAAKGALVEEPSRVVVADKGPELILPARLTKMFLALAEAGLGEGSWKGGSSPRIVIEDHTVHEHFWNGRKVCDLVMSQAESKLRLRGAVPVK